MRVVARAAVLLEPPVAGVDKPGMSQQDLQFDCLNTQNLRILQSYADRMRAARAAGAEHDGWLERLESADDTDADQLTRIHGELIALGMLTFELSSRHTGLRYRVSDRGLAAVERAAVPSATEETDGVSDCADADSERAEATVSHSVAEAA